MPVWESVQREEGGGDGGKGNTREGRQMEGREGGRENGRMRGWEEGKEGRSVKLYHVQIATG